METEHKKGNLHVTTTVADNVFRALFNNAERAVELYELVSGDTCDPGEIEICTLPDNSLLSRFNDVTFRVRGRLLFFFEHQSTPCPNMPVRLLRYFTDVLYLDPNINSLIYGRKLHKISKPEFYVLYDGAEKWNKKQLLLSDAFDGLGDDIEMRVNIINCKEISKQETSTQTMLSGFLACMVWYRGLIAEGLHHDVAVRTALDEAAKSETLFGQYVKENYKEVLNMLTFAYSKEAEHAVLKQEGFEEGKTEGISQTLRAVKLLREGISDEQVMKEVGFTKEELDDLKAIM